MTCVFTGNTTLYLHVLFDDAYFWRSDVESIVNLHLFLETHSSKFWQISTFIHVKNAAGVETFNRNNYVIYTCPNNVQL